MPYLSAYFAQMNKADYILKSLSKIRHKPYEHYVVSRIVHLLDDPEIEFICQQLVRRPGGKRALTDMYFPQFGIHLEVDEGYHANVDQLKLDALRQADIVDATTQEVHRILAHGDKNLGDDEHPFVGLNIQIRDFVQRIKDLKSEATDFRPWSINRGFDPLPHIEVGRISVSGNVAFRYQRDALQLFGYNGGHYQAGSWRIKRFPGNQHVWFPRLWRTPDWQNSLSNDGRTIRETALNTDIQADSPPTSDNSAKRITFAKWSDPLGRTVYRFTGIFEKDMASSQGPTSIYRRTADSVLLPK